MSARLHVGRDTLQPETSQSSNKSSCRVRKGHRWKGGIRLALCRHQMQRTATMSKSIKGLLHKGATNTMHRGVNHRHGFGHDLLPKKKQGCQFNTQPSQPIKAFQEHPCRQCSYLRGEKKYLDVKPASNMKKLTTILTAS